MYRTKKPEIMAMRPKVQRRMHLEDLGKALCEVQIRDRVAQWEETEFRGVTKHLQEVARRHDVLREAGVRSILAGARSRCYLCPRRLDKKNEKSMRFVRQTSLQGPCSARQSCARNV